MKLILLFLISFNLWAANGNEVGNGGDGLVCANKPIILFDYFEARQLNKQKMNYASGKDWYEISSNTIKRLEKLAPVLHKQYKRVLSKLKARLVFVEKANFRDIKDSFEVALPEGCKLEQLAIQQDDPNGKRKIYISQKFWDKLDKQQRAGLILHEIIYEHFVNLGEKNSIKARKVNSILASQKIRGFDKNKFAIFLRRLKLSLY